MRRMILLLALLGVLLASGIAVQAQSSPIVHVVQAGENLYRISLRYGVSLAEIASANNIPNPNLIFVGQQLTIPGTTGGSTPQPTPTPGGGTTPPPATGTTTYTVVAGDTLASIARRFGTTFQAIAAANGIANPNLIYVGQVLNISGSSDGGTTPPPVNPTPAPPNPPVTTPVTGFNLGGHVTQGNYPFSDLMRGTGMTWAKRQIVWERGTPASNYQGEIDAAHSRGFKVLLSVVGHGADLASNPSQYYQEFANFLGGLARAGADAIEVWNEPNIPREWPSGQVSGAGYTQMLSAAYQVIKANNSSTLVISAAPAPSGGLPNNASGGFNDDAFISAMAAAGAANFMDCVGIHFNAGTTPASARSGAPVGSATHYSWYYPTMVDLYTRVFPSKPLCFTEIGYLSGEGFSTPLPGGFSWAGGTSVQEQAQWLAEAAVLARNSGRVRLFIVWNIDSNVWGDDPQAGYAIVRPNGTCPACNTLASSLQ
jgi:LysM repeat protein